jgi:RHS repeat-associated protein
VLRLFAEASGGTVLHEQEDYLVRGRLVNTASWSWQQLAVGKLATVDCWAEVYVENLSSQAVWFDDLEIATGALPVAIVVQETHYDPWGLELAGIGYVADPTKESKFTYNGKEKQDQFGLGWLDYGARHYQADIARWGGVDGRASKYISSSPYHYCANNPVRFLDVDGNEYTPDADAWATRIGTAAQDGIDKATAEISRLMSGRNASKNLNKLANKIKEQLTVIGKYSDVQKELTNMRESSQLYHTSSISGNNGTSTTTFGFMEHQGTTRGVVTMNINSDSPNELGSAAHEFKHGYQFEVGQMDFAANGRSTPGDLYDRNDEIEAFQRGQLFGSNVGATIDGRFLEKRGYQLAEGPQVSTGTQLADGTTYGQRALENIYQAGASRGQGTGALSNSVPRSYVIGWEAAYQAGVGSRQVQPAPTLKNNLNRN